MVLSLASSCYLTRQIASNTSSMTVLFIHRLMVFGRIAVNRYLVLVFVYIDFPDEVKMQPLIDFPSSLYRASVTDSETECSSESDEMDSDSGYGIGGRRASCHCSSYRHASPVTECRQLPVCMDDCTPVALSPADRLVLVARQWPSTSVSCSYSTAMHQVVDASDRVGCTSTATSPKRQCDDTHTASVGVGTTLTARQPAYNAVNLHVLSIHLA